VYTEQLLNNHVFYIGINALITRIYPCHLNAGWPPKYVEYSDKIMPILMFDEEIKAVESVQCTFPDCPHPVSSLHSMA